MAAFTLIVNGGVWDKADLVNAEGRLLEAIRTIVPTASSVRIRTADYTPTKAEDLAFVADATVTNNPPARAKWPGKTSRAKR